ncbi:MAG: M1 family aminopeptidase [Marinilabiliales bacterium]
MPDILKCRKPVDQNKNLIVSPLLLKYDVSFYHLDVEVSNTSTYISGNTYVEADVIANNMDTFAIQLHDNLLVDSIIFNGSNETFNHSNNLITVKLSTPLSSGSHFGVYIYYHGTSVGGGMSTDTYMYGLYSTTWTLSESFHAHDWFACKEDLTDKADSVYIFATVNDNLKVGSNGLLDNIVNLGNGKVRYEWKCLHPIDYYLISLTTAEFVEYNQYAHPSGYSDSILIQNYVYNYTSNVLGEIDETVALIEFFSDLYGLYPFADEKYGHCLAPIGGGMEHQTMTTMGWFEFWIIAHEMAHQWFGDYITCASWQDIWVNEGFASYSEYLANQYLKTQADADSWMDDAHSRALDYPDGSVYLNPAEAVDETRIFNYALTYKKGASIIHTIRFQLNNDSIFFKTLRDFIANHADSVAVGVDFRDQLYVNSGIDFTDFFNQWYYGFGFPIYNVYWSHYNDTLHLHVEQTTSSTYTTFFGNDVEYKVEFSGGDTIFRVSMNSNIQDYEFYLPENVTNIIVDPNDWILDEQGVVVNSLLQESPDYNVYVYPQPVSDILHIDLPENIESNILITDLSGRTILSSSRLSGKQLLDVSHFKNGFYLITVSDSKHSKTTKILKN